MRGCAERYSRDYFSMVFPGLVERLDEEMMR